MNKTHCLIPSIQSFFMGLMCMFTESSALNWSNSLTFWKTSLPPCPTCRVKGRRTTPRAEEKKSCAGVDLSLFTFLFSCFSQLNVWRQNPLGFLQELCCCFLWSSLKKKKKFSLDWNQQGALLLCVDKNTQVLLWLQLLSWIFQRYLELRPVSHNTTLVIIQAC